MSRNFILTIFLIACGESAETDDQLLKADANTEEEVGESGSDAGAFRKAPTATPPDDSPDSGIDSATEDAASGTSEPDADLQPDSGVNKVTFEPGQERFMGKMVCWEADLQTGHFTVISEDGSSCFDSEAVKIYVEQNEKNPAAYIERGTCWRGLCCNAGCWNGSECVPEETSLAYYQWMGRPCDDVM